MAWTEDDVTILEAAITSGKKEVQFKDRKVVYHDVSQMLKLLGVMKAEVAAASTSSLRTTYTSHSRD